MSGLDEQAERALEEIRRVFQELPQMASNDSDAPLEEDQARREDEIFNERIKLFSDAMNNMATNTLAGGVLAPIVAIFWKMSPPATDLSPVRLLVGLFTWFLVSSVIHVIGQYVLGYLKAPS